MRVLQFRSVAVILTLMLSAGRLCAECIPLWKTLKDAEDRSTLVFSGTVTESDDAILVSFNIDRVWRGALKQHTTLVVMPGMEVYPADFFKPGRTYVGFRELDGNYHPRRRSPSFQQVRRSTRSAFAVRPLLSLTSEKASTF